MYAGVQFREEEQGTHSGKEGAVLLLSWHFS
jgi:hypothetical protein